MSHNSLHNSLHHSLYDSRGGFSLIEVVFAMSFLTVIILGVVNLQNANLVMVNRQNHEIQAHFYANHGLKVAEALGYATLNGSCPGAPDAIRNCKLQKNTNYNAIEEGGIPEKIDDLYYRSFTLDPTGLTDGFKAECKVTWEDGTGDHEVTAKRIIYQ